MARVTKTLDKVPTAIGVIWPGMQACERGESAPIYQVHNNGQQFKAYDVSWEPMTRAYLQNKFAGTKQLVRNLSVWVEVWGEVEVVVDE